MKRYRVTIPPFEVYANSPDDAESIVDDLVERGQFGYEIEDITGRAPHGAVIHLHRSDGDGDYALDGAHTTYIGDGHYKGWRSERWRSAEAEWWITSWGFFPVKDYELINDKETS